MAINFDGSSGYFDVGRDSSLQPTSAITYMAWINADGLGELNGGRIIDMQLPAITMLTTNRCNHYMTTSAGGYDLYSNNNAVSLGDDHLIAMTYDGSNFYCYVDAVQQTDTEAFSGTISYGAYNMFLGNSPNNINARTFDGRIWDARVYNRGLSQAEITTAYNARGNDNITSGLISRWLMNEESTGETAGTALDIGGSGNDGASSGTLTYHEKPITLTRRPI